MGQTSCSIASLRTFRCHILTIYCACLPTREYAWHNCPQPVRCHSSQIEVGATLKTHMTTPRHCDTDSRVVMAAWQAEDESLQARALQALQGFAKGKRGGVSMPMHAVQEAFQKGGGLPRLVALLDRAATPKPGGASQRRAITSGAVDALAAMTRNHSSARCHKIIKTHTSFRRIRCPPAARANTAMKEGVWRTQAAEMRLCMLQEGGHRGRCRASIVQRFGHWR